MPSLPPQTLAVWFWTGPTEGPWMQLVLQSSQSWRMVYYSSQLTPKFVQLSMSFSWEPYAYIKMNTKYRIANFAGLLNALIIG